MQCDTVLSATEMSLIGRPSMRNCTSFVWEGHSNYSHYSRLQFSIFEWHIVRLYFAVLVRNTIATFVQQLTWYNCAGSATNVPFYIQSTSDGTLHVLFPLLPQHKIVSVVGANICMSSLQNVIPFFTRQGLTKNKKTVISCAAELSCLSLWLTLRLHAKQNVKSLCPV